MLNKRLLVIVTGILAVTFTACSEDPVRPIPIEGQWGADGLIVVIEHHGGTLEYDCAQGTIDEPVVLNSRGRFDVLGTHTPDCGGPCPPGEPIVRPSRYQGSIVGDTLLITVTLTDTGVVIGSFTVVRDASGRLHKCV